MHLIYHALTQETANIHKEAREVPCPQPCLLVMGEQMKEIFLVIEKNVISKLSASTAPLALLSAFYFLICTIPLDAIIFIGFLK